MKKFLKYPIFALALVLCFNAGQAQQKLQLRIGYSVNTPTGSAFRELIEKSSFRGVEGELSYPVNEKLKIGLGVAFSDYYQKYPRQAYDTKDGTISAVLTNSIQTTPVLAKANYQFTTTGVIRPYVGAGAGINVIRYAQYLGEFPSSKTSLKAAFSGDAGVNVPFSKAKPGAGFNLGVNYNYLPYDNSIAKNLNDFGVHAGVFFPLK